MNYCGKFIPHLATLSEPLRQLTRNGNKFVWGANQITAFESLKEEIEKGTKLFAFDKDLPIVLITDASDVGLGGVLLQECRDGTLRPVAFASRGLTKIEKKYSTTEKEALGIIWACEHFHTYLFGCTFRLKTDHRPLLYLYSRKSKPSARIERWVLRLQCYDFTVEHVPGHLNIADPLSRLSFNPSDSDDATEKCVRFLTQSSVPHGLSAKDIERESEFDEELMIVREAIRSNGWESREVPLAYKVIRHELTAIGQLILRGTRIVIPLKLRDKVVNLGHEGHQGIVKTKQLRLRSKVWWPSMDKDAKRKCRNCKECILVTVETQKEPIVRTPLPHNPWEVLSMDFLGPFQNGKRILVVVDYFSRWFEARVMSRFTCDDLIKVLDDVWAIHGYPLTILSDNGPPFQSEKLADYFQEIKVKHRYELLRYGLRQTARWKDKIGLC